jgi:hypothetical protein
MDSGKIPRPPVYVLESMSAKMRQAIGDLRDAVRAQPSRQPELDRAEADLAAVEAELQTLRPTPTKRPAPAKKSNIIADGGE